MVPASNRWPAEDSFLLHCNKYFTILPVKQFPALSKHQDRRSNLAGASDALIFYLYQKDPFTGVHHVSHRVLLWQEVWMV